MEHHHATTANTATPHRSGVVLLVEDAPLLRGITAEFLRSAGYRVIEAPTAMEAVAYLSSGQSVDVVFSDVCVPESRDGLALADWLRERRCC